MRKLIDNKKNWMGNNYCISFIFFCLYSSAPFILFKADSGIANLMPREEEYLRLFLSSSHGTRGVNLKIGIYKILELQLVNEKSTKQQSLENWSSFYKIFDNDKKKKKIFKIWNYKQDNNCKLSPIQKLIYSKTF